MVTVIPSGLGMSAGEVRRQVNYKDDNKFVIQ